MPNNSASKAASAASLALIAFISFLALLIHQSTLVGEISPAKIVLLSIALASSAVVHLVFIALLANRAGWPVVKITALALCTLPIGSIVGLVLYEWHTRADAVSEEHAA